MYNCIFCCKKFYKNIFTADGKLRQLCERCEIIYTNTKGNGGVIFAAQLKNLSIILDAMQYPRTYSANVIQCGATSIENWNQRGLIFPHQRYYNHSLEIRSISEMKTHTQSWRLGDYDLFYLADLTTGLRNALFAGDKMEVKKGELRW